MMAPMKWLLFVVMLLPQIADAATTYYVGKSGSDGNSCATAQSSTAGNRKLTISAGLGCLAAGAGDTLIIGDGTYVESLDDIVPSGGGTDATRTLIRCENSRLCTLDASFWAWNLKNSDTNWITIQDMVICCGDTVLVRLGSDTAPPSTNYPHHIRVQNNEIHTSPIYPVYTGHGDGNEWLNNTIHACGEQCVYLLETNSVWRGNELYNIGTSGNGQGFTLHVSGGMGSANVLMEKNYIHDCVPGIKPVGIEIADTNGHTIRQNIIAGCSLAGIRANTGTTSNSKIDHNTLYGAGSGIGIHISAVGSTSNLVRNNIVLNYTTPVSICGGCGTETTNLTTGVATDLFVSPSTGDFRLKSGSAAIDAGTNIGLPYNGTAPDQGAFETPTFNACSVENGDPTHIRIRMNNAAADSMFPLTDITGFTARKNTSSHSITAAAVNGTDYAFLTVAAFAAGDTVDISYTAGNFAARNLVGNQYNQAYLGTLTNQSCLNNLQSGGGGGGGTIGRGAKGLGLF